MFYWTFSTAGYIVMESFASGEEIESMRKRMEQLLDEFDYSANASIFSTKNQVARFSLLFCDFFYAYYF